jgi:hypothetical protein
MGKIVFSCGVKKASWANFYASFCDVKKKEMFTEAVSFISIHRTLILSTSDFQFKYSFPSYLCV